MRRVLIDFIYYQSEAKYHGGGEYGNTVINALLEQNANEYLGIFCYKNCKKNYELLERCKNEGWNIHEIEEISDVGKIVEKYNYDAIYSPLPYEIDWKKANIKRNIEFICTVHGLRAIENAQYMIEERAFWGDSNKKGSHEYLYNFIEPEKESADYMRYYDSFFTFDRTEIVTVSEYSKYAICSFFPEIDMNKIHVMYSPLKTKINIHSEDQILSSYNLSKNEYSLIVSAGIWYKNSLRAVMAYDYIFKRKIGNIPLNYKVLLVGVNNKERLLSKIENKERFLILDYVETMELEIFMKNAHSLVYPSLNEGFGYPPIEAMKYETICLCSANASIPEVCQNMVLYFNPFLIQDVVNKILQSFSDNIRKKLVKSIRDNLCTVMNKQKDDLLRLVDLILDC